MGETKVNTLKPAATGGEPLGYAIEGQMIMDMPSHGGEKTFSGVSKGGTGVYSKAKNTGGASGK